MLSFVLHFPHSYIRRDNRAELRFQLEEGGVKKSAIHLNSQLVDSDCAREVAEEEEAIEEEEHSELVGEVRDPGATLPGGGSEWKSCPVNRGGNREGDDVEEREEEGEAEAWSRFK